MTLYFVSLYLQDVALALEAHESLVRETFGPEAQLELLSGLQVRYKQEDKHSIQRRRYENMKTN
jgi:hypothetical protein